MFVIITSVSEAFVLLADFFIFWNWFIRIAIAKQRELCYYLDKSDCENNCLD